MNGFFPSLNDITTSPLVVPSMIWNFDVSLNWSRLSGACTELTTSMLPVMRALFIAVGSLKYFNDTVSVGGFVPQ